jgi:hypothetical protein
MVEMEILGMNIGCVLAALSDKRIPEKDCLLPLISKLLGYCIVAASTTVKLPQVFAQLRPIPIHCANFILRSVITRSGVGSAVLTSIFS